MTETDWTTLEQYIRTIADMIGMKDWGLKLLRELPEHEEAGASVNPAEGRKFTEISVAKDFMEYEAEKQTHYILHELIHCHLQPASDIIRVDLWEHRTLSQESYNILFSAFHRQIEYAVDGMATALATLFPKIEWLNK